MGGDPLISGHIALHWRCCAGCDTLARFDMSTRVPLTADVGRTHRLTRLSHQPVDRASPSRFACMPHDGKHKIAISAGATSLAHTSAYWHFHLPVFDHSPFPTTRRIGGKEHGYTAQSNRPEICDFSVKSAIFPACQFTGEQIPAQNTQSCRHSCSLFYFELMHIYTTHICVFCPNTFTFQLSFA